MLEQDKKQQLVQSAIEALKGSYSPYSHYPVGAALLTRSGQVFLGANVENAVYPVSLCAERVAVFKAVTEGQRHTLRRMPPGVGRIRAGYPGDHRR